MILCDTEIRAAIGSGQVIIDPPPVPEHYGTSSLDLTLGKEFTQWKKAMNMPGAVLSVDPSAKGFYPAFASQYQESAPVDHSGAATIQPGGFLLAMTEQRIELPHESRIAARVEGRSSLARLGLSIHLTAPTVHSGFRGRVALEITNHGPVPILLCPGLVICQLIFEMVFGTPSQAMTGIFQDQSSVVGKPPAPSPP
jgi:dCTP deaminase